MVLIIIGIFIQFLCLAVQVIQLRLARPGDPKPQHPVPVAEWTAPPSHGETAQACLELERQHPTGDLLFVTSLHLMPGLRRRPALAMVVLLKIWAKCVDGQDDIAKRRIEAALGEPADQDDALPGTPTEDG